MATPTYVSKVLAAASSTSVGTFSSAGVATLSTTQLDTARRILIWGSSALGASITLNGLSQTQGPISEVVLSSTTVGGTATSKQDFILINSITLSCGVASTAGYLGTSSNGGTPWTPIDTTKTPPYVGFFINPTSSLITTSFEYTMDYPQYNPYTASWQGATVASVGPQPTISSMGSSVQAATVGYINFPITAWRMTISSTSSAAGTANATVFQSGV